MRLACLLVFSAVICAAADPPKLRLPTGAEPVSYAADLTLNPQSDDFTGTIDIQLNVREATPVLWLNANKITVDEAAADVNGKRVAAKVIPGGEDYIGFEFATPLPKGNATLKLRYKGKIIQQNSAGLFRMKDGDDWYIFTQFEATDARAAFPCFDEPSYKTPWQLTLRVPEGLRAVSNTPSLGEKTQDGITTIRFAQTKPLPSYLIAIGVGPFDIVDGGKSGKKQIPVRIIAPKGKGNEAKYAASVTATILARLEDYFGIPYPYEKLDNMAIPSTFGFGAMENAGLVTYAQNLILAKPEIDTINRQRGYAITAAHELAHQWFGDLVTTAWWDDIWLNEAFATWMEGKLIAEWKPEWNTRLNDVGGKLGAMGEDSLISSRKIRQEIASKDDINSAFDGITYQKGAAVIGMFESWMGEENFRKGVQSYMKQYAFRATTAGDFLDSLSSSSKRDVTKAFSTFLNQPGVPIVSVALDCSKTAPVLKLEQKRFLPLGSKGNVNEVWSIPVCVRYGSNDAGTRVCKVITQAQTELPLEGAKSCPTWVQANADAVGYYRVNYQGNLLAALSEGGGKRLSGPERVDLMGNASALSNSGQLPAADALALAETFHADPQRQIVQDALDLATRPRRNLVPDDLIPNHQRFLKKNFGERAEALGWQPKPGEPEDTKLLRPQLLRTMATQGGDEALGRQARELADKWLADHSAVDPNLVSAVLGTAAYYGDKSLFDRYLAEFKKTKNRQQRQQLIGAMASFRDLASIQAGQQALLSGDIPFIEGAFLLFNAGESEATAKVPFEFVKTHFDEIVSKMPTGGGFDFGSVLPRTGQIFCDTSSREELQQFFGDKVAKFSGATRALAQTVEAVDLCIAIKAAQQPSVVAFLKKY